MNLHIIQEGVFAEAFYGNLKVFDLLGNNKFFIRHTSYFTGRMDANIPHGKLDELESKVGKTTSFDKVFIHQLPTAYYKWIADHEFNELNWLIWGADLYHLPFIKQFLYEPLTLQKYVKDAWSWNEFLFKLKYNLITRKHKVSCYSKIDNILTWMHGEYDFARRAIPELEAGYKFFIYENKIPYDEIVSFRSRPESVNKVPKLIIGNSGTPSNNHLDAVRNLMDQNIMADLLLPVSYGEKKYIEFLKRNLCDYKNGTITFLDKFLPVHEYLSLLQSCDALVINSIRPQAYGNIFMMMLLNKPVFFNSRNISLQDLNHYRMEWRSMENLKQFLESKESFLPDNEGLLNLTSRENLRRVYKDLFS